MRNAIFINMYYFKLDHWIMQSKTFIGVAIMVYESMYHNLQIR